jgi:hypothetical protein
MDGPSKRFDGQLHHLETTFQKKHSAEIKIFRDKMDEWSDAYRNHSPEQKGLKRELYALLSAYEKKTGGAFYQ